MNPRTLAIGSDWVRSRWSISVVFILLGYLVPLGGWVMFQWLLDEFSSLVTDDPPTLLFLSAIEDTNNKLLFGLVPLVVFIFITGISKLQVSVKWYFLKPVTNTYLTWGYYIGGFSLALAVTWPALFTISQVGPGYLSLSRTMLLMAGGWGILYPILREPRITVVFEVGIAISIFMLWMSLPQMQGVYIPAFGRRVLDFSIAAFLFSAGGLATYIGIRNQRSGSGNFVGRWGSELSQRFFDLVRISKPRDESPASAQLWYELSPLYKTYWIMAIAPFSFLLVFGVGLAFTPAISLSPVLDLWSVILTQWGIGNGFILALVGFLVPVLGIHEFKGWNQTPIELYREHGGIDRFSAKLPISDRLRSNTLLLSVLRVAVVTSLLYVIPLLVIGWFADPRWSIPTQTEPAQIRSRIYTGWVIGGGLWWSWITIANATALGYSKRPLIWLLLSIGITFAFLVSASVLPQDTVNLLHGLMALAVLLLTVVKFAEAIRLRLLTPTSIMPWLIGAFAVCWVVWNAIQKEQTWVAGSWLVVSVLVTIYPIAAVPVAIRRSRAI